MTARDKLEVGSKSWNKGKWNQLVAPFLPNDCSELTLVDMGCNAGLFLKLAQDKGFNRVVGVDSDESAVKRGRKWRSKNGGEYHFILSPMESSLDHLPMSDFTLFANSHYYFKTADWLEYLNILKHKTRFCIIVTAKKIPATEYAASDIEGIRNNFGDWKEKGFIDLPPDNTPHSRQLWGLCFENPLLKRVPVHKLDNGNAQQRNFLKELDRGISLFKTGYYRRLKSYRSLKSSGQIPWSKERLDQYMNERVELYEDIKKNGLKEALVIDPKNMRVTDGNHRHDAARHLGHKSIICKQQAI